MAVIDMFKMEWVMPRTIEDLFLPRNFGVSSFRERFYGSQCYMLPFGSFSGEVIESIV